MKKVLSLVLALSMVLGSFGMVFADTPAVAFDELAGHENEEAIVRLNKLGIVEGDERGFAADETITRAEFAVLLVRALGLENSANAAKGTTQFTDVTPELEWASGAINVASRLGYVEGHGNGMFGPREEINYEQAVTMIVRALGYKPAAEEKGGYPIGYLVVAEQDLDLDDNVTAVQGLASTRGAVFQLLDNALTKPMMEQVGYGDDRNYEVPEDYNTLLSQLGFDKEEGRVVDFDSDDLEIIVLDEDGDKEEFLVEKGFDFEEAHGLEVTLWVDGDDVVTFELEKEALYDAVEVTEAEEEIELVEAGDDYELTEDTIVFINGDEEDIEELEEKVYNYGKVVVDKGEVIFISVYELDEFIVVEEIEDEVIFGYGDELDVEDFTIVENGKTMSLEDLEEGDILFFNESDDYAELFNEYVEGEIERVYEESFEVEDEEFDYYNENFETDMRYVNDDEILDFDADAADDMMDAEEDVRVFIDRHGDAVYVVGELGDAATTSFYAFATADVDDIDARRNTLWAVDLITEDGEELKVDIDADDVDLFDEDENELTWDEDVFVVNDVVEVEIDEDGDVTAITLLDVNESNVEFEADDSYVEGLKLSSSVIAFDIEDFTNDADDIVVSTLKDADFDEILNGHVYADEDDKVIVVVVEESDKESDTTDYDAVVTSDSSKLRGENTWRVELNIDGEEEDYFTEEDAFTRFNYDEGTFLTVELDDETNEIVDVTRVDDAEYEYGEVTVESTRNRTIEVNNTEYRLEDATIIDATDSYKVKNFRDIEDGDYIELFLAADGSRYVQYAVIVEEGNNQETSEVEEAAAIQEVADAANATEFLAVLKTRALGLENINESNEDAYFTAFTTEDTVEALQTLIDTTNEEVAITAVDDATDAAEFLSALKSKVLGLEDINESNEDAYFTAFTTEDTVEALQTLINDVNDDELEQPISDAIGTVTSAVYAEDFLEALEIEVLGLENIVEDNADDYFAVFTNEDTPEALQTLINAVNTAVAEAAEAREEALNDVNGASTWVQMTSALKDNASTLDINESNVTRDVADTMLAEAPFESVEEVKDLFDVIVDALN